MKCAKDILRELHVQGFKRLWRYRGTAINLNLEVICYIAIKGDRKLDLQLWSNGDHRVSHWINGYTKHGRMCTPPTDFSTVEELRSAIKHELTRTDHPNA